MDARLTIDQVNMVNHRGIFVRCLRRLLLFIGAGAVVINDVLAFALMVVHPRGASDGSLGRESGLARIWSVLALENAMAKLSMVA